MADLGPRDRQDLPIWSAIEANNFKQALKLVDKRISKKPSDYLEALRIYVRSRSPLVTEKSSVLIHIEELSARKPPVTDLEAIELYDESLGEVLPEKGSVWARTIGEVRWQCVKTAPKNEEIALKCFQECLSHGDLDHARQISNTLEKSFPGNRAYIFWNISAMFLYSTSLSCPEAQKKIWGGLALGQITKLASATKQAEDPKKLASRAIQTSQELLLLLRITTECGKKEQILEYLGDSQLGPDSVVAKGEWELWRMRLKLLEDGKKWQDLFDISRSLLQRARAKDSTGKIIEPGMSDWIVWEAFIKSAIELPGHKQKPEVLIELEAHLDPDSGIDKTWRRNASLAWVKFCFEAATPFSVVSQSSEGAQTLNHIPIVFKYLQKFADASTAYNDLKPYVERLDAEERAQLLKLVMRYDVWAESGGTTDSEKGRSNLGALGEDLSTANNIARVINVYKIRYLLVSALTEHERLHSPVFRPGVDRIRCVACGESCRRYCVSCLRSLAIDSIKAYKSSVEDDGRITKTLLSTDRHPADDFCILAAMCMIKLALSDESSSFSDPLDALKTTYIIQAALLLEYGWTKSQSNFQYSLLLIRLYTYLGNGSLAMRAYQRLAPKQIQLDTLSYTVFDRIATQHPHDVSHIPEGTTPHNSLQSLIQKQQKVYRNSRGQIAKNTWTSFKHGNYNSVFEMKEASDTLSRTLAGAMSVVESRQIARLTEPEADLTGNAGGYDILPQNPEHAATKFIDTNDYLTFPSFESSQGPSFEFLSRFAPGPSSYRYQTNLVGEKLKQIVFSPPEARAELLLWLIDYVDHKPLVDSPIDGLLTKSEELVKRTQDDIAVLLREVSDKGRWNDEKFEARVEVRNHSLRGVLDDNARLIERKKNVVPALWETLHILYSAYDVARTALGFCGFCSAQGKSVHESQVTANKEVSQAAQQLLAAVLEKSQLVKKGFDEGGWIDRVIDGGLPTSGDAQLTGDVVRELVNENFLEEWAGLVVESWGESIQGLSLLRPLK